MWQAGVWHARSLSHVNRFLRILATALITAGLVVALDVGLTLAWKEPLSSLYGKFKQNQAEDDAEGARAGVPSAADLDAVASAGDLEERVAALPTASRIAA